MSDHDENYRSAADGLAALTGQMISYLENAPENSIGARWRRMAQSTLSRFNAAKMAKQQRTLFDEDGS